MNKVKNLSKISFQDRLNLLRRIDAVKPLITEAEFDILSAKIRAGTIQDADIKYVSTLGGELNIEFESL